MGCKDNSNMIFGDRKIFFGSCAVQTTTMGDTHQKEAFSYHTHLFVPGVGKERESRP
jgi:hypothetical protein